MGLLSTSTLHLQCAAHDNRLQSLLSCIHAQLLQRRCLAAALTILSCFWHNEQTR